MWYEGFFNLYIKMNRIVFLNKIPIFTLCFILMSIKFDSHKKYLTAVGIQTISAALLLWKPNLD